jgi:Phage gp6-like head-tail connector protein
MAEWPKLAEVRQWLRLQPNPDDDALISSALAAAIDYGNRRTDYKYDPATVPVGGVPEAVHEACLIHAGRLYKRRDSIDGALGWGDSGFIRIGRSDPDAVGLYDAVGPMVFG